MYPDAIQMKYYASAVERNKKLSTVIVSITSDKRQLSVVDTPRSYTFTDLKQLLAVNRVNESRVQ